MESWFGKVGHRTDQAFFSFLHSFSMGESTLYQPFVSFFFLDEGFGEGRVWICLIFL